MMSSFFDVRIALDAAQEEGSAAVSTIAFLNFM